MPEWRGASKATGGPRSNAAAFGTQLVPRTGGARGWDTNSTRRVADVSWRRRSSLVRSEARPVNLSSDPRRHRRSRPLTWDLLEPSPDGVGAAEPPVARMDAGSPRGLLCTDGRMPGQRQRLLRPLDAARCVDPYRLRGDHLLPSRRAVRGVAVLRHHRRGTNRELDVRTEGLPSDRRDERSRRAAWCDRPRMFERGTRLLDAAPVDHLGPRSRFSDRIIAERVAWNPRARRQRS